MSHRPHTLNMLTSIHLVSQPETRAWSLTLSSPLATVPHIQIDHPVLFTYFIPSNSPHLQVPNIGYTTISCLNYFKFPKWFACLQSIFCLAFTVMCVQSANIIIIFCLRLYMALLCSQSTMNLNTSPWLTSWSGPCLPLQPQLLLVPPPTQSSHTRNYA